MTNTFAMREFDRYNDEAHDDFLRRKRRGRRRIRRFVAPRFRTKRYPRHVKRRRTRLARTYRKPVLRRPKIVRSVPIKSVPKKTRVVITSNKRMSAPLVFKRPVRRIVRKPQVLKVKKKTPIRHLMKKTPPKRYLKSPIATPLKTPPKAINGILTRPPQPKGSPRKSTQILVHKKAMQSDAKTSKVVKVVAMVGAVSIVGFGIYKYMQLKT